MFFYRSYSKHSYKVALARVLCDIIRSAVPRILHWIKIDYFMVGERVRFYARVVKDCKRTSERAKRTSEFSNLSQQVHNKNRTSEPTMK